MENAEVRIDHFPFTKQLTIFHSPNKKRQMILLLTNKWLDKYTFSKNTSERPQIGYQFSSILLNTNII